MFRCCLWFLVSFAACGPKWCLAQACYRSGCLACSRGWQPEMKNREVDLFYHLIQHLEVLDSRIPWGIWFCIECVRPEHPSTCGLKWWQKSRRFFHWACWHILMQRCPWYTPACPSTVTKLRKKGRWSQTKDDMYMVESMMFGIFWNRTIDCFGHAYCLRKKRACFSLQKM